MEKLDDFIDALQQITEAKGRYSRDPSTYAKNCICDMQAVAVHVLRKWGVKPRREDDAVDGELIPVREFERSDAA